MEDFFYAGGLGALLGRIGDLLDLSCATVNGHSLGENIADARVYNDQVIVPRDASAVAGRRARGSSRQPGA